MSDEKKTTRLGGLSYAAIGMLGGILLMGLLAWAAFGIRDMVQETAREAAGKASDEHTQRLVRLEKSNVQIVKYLTEVANNQVNQPKKPKLTPQVGPQPAPMPVHGPPTKTEAK